MSLMTHFKTACCEFADIKNYTLQLQIQRLSAYQIQLPSYLNERCWTFITMRFEMCSENYICGTCIPRTHLRQSLKEFNIIKENMKESYTDSTDSIRKSGRHRSVLAQKWFDNSLCCSQIPSPLLERSERSSLCTCQ